MQYPHFQGLSRLRIVSIFGIIKVYSIVVRAQTVFYFVFHNVGNSFLLFYPKGKSISTVVPNS